MRLQARLAVTVALAAALAIVAMALSFWVLGARQQRAVIDDQLLATVSQPRELLPDATGRGGGGRRGFGDVFQDGADDAADRLFTRVRISVPNGPVLIDDGLPGVDYEQTVEPQLSTIDLDGERFRMAVATLDGANRPVVLQVAINIEDNEAGLARFRFQLVFASALGILLAALLGSIVAQRLSQPITSVASAAREMANSRQLPSPIQVDRTDEVGDLATSFNDMLAALELSRQQQHRLIGDASHELRTPLTSLRLKLDLLDATPDLETEQRQTLLAASAAEVEQLSDLVTELVDLATDPTGVDEQSAEASLLSLVNEVVANQRRRTGREIEVIGGAVEETFMLRPKMVTRAISNIVDNAIKYSPEGMGVTVIIDGSRVQAQDRGPGIPPEDLPYVFDRFFRSATARTRPGNGIGLAIVQRVADLHGGSVWAKNAEDGSGAIVGFSVAP